MAKTCSYVSRTLVIIPERTADLRIRSALPRSKDEERRGRAVFGDAGSAATRPPTSDEQLHCGPQLRPALDERHCRNAAQLARFNLVEPAAIDSSLAAQFVAGDTSQEPVDRQATLGFSAEKGGEAALWIQHEVQVRPDGGRAVPDEAKRLFFFGAPAHIRAKEGRRQPLLLLVPRRPLADEIAVFDPHPLSGFEVCPKGRVAGLDNMLRQLAVDEAELWVEPAGSHLRRHR